MKEIIEATIKDLVSNLLYYDRREDEELPRGAIEKAIEDGEVTIDDMINTFSNELTTGLAKDK